MRYIFLNVFYQPHKSLIMLSKSLVHHRNFFLFYGLPLMVIGSAGRVIRGVRSFEQVEGVAYSASGISLAGLLFFINLISFVIAVLLGARLIARLSPRFGPKASFGTMLKLIVFAYTPFLLAQVLAFPGVAGNAISIVGLLYTIWLYAQGTRLMAFTPHNKLVGFTLVSFFILFGIFYIVSLFSTGLIIFDVK